MSAQGLLFALILIGTVALWVFSPLVTEPPKRRDSFHGQGAIPRQREQLSELYEQALRNILDLDDDYATGKTSGIDYQRERERWTQRAISLLKALDSLDAQSIMAPETPEDAEVDDAIEAAIAAYRSKQS
ncbi:MAG: hypothetical protein U0694_29610 [Anaerolineae bacterium]